MKSVLMWMVYLLLVYSLKAVQLDLLKDDCLALRMEFCWDLMRDNMMD